MVFRPPISSLFAGLIILGLAHACYYQYYQESPADYKYRQCQVGCFQDINPGQEHWDGCCLPLAPGAFPPAVCTELASSAEGKGTSCAWSAVETHDMPSSFQQPPPRTTVVPPAASTPCITTWVTETASPSCAPAISAVPTSTEVASKINAVPTSLDLPQSSLLVPGSSTSVVVPPAALPTTTAPPAIVSSTITSSTAPPNHSNTCACTYEGALEERDDLQRRGGANTCACPNTPSSTSVKPPTNTCVCHVEGALQERDMKGRTYPANTCACPAGASKTSAAAPCQSGHNVEGALQERGNNQCLSGAVPDGAAIVEAPNKKRELPPDDFIPEDPGSASLIHSLPTSQPVVPHSPEEPSSALVIAAPPCTTTMTTTITPACEPTDKPGASLINGVLTSSLNAEPSKTIPHPANPTESEDCDEYEDDDEHGDHAEGSLQYRDFEFSDE